MYSGRVEVFRITPGGRVWTVIIMAVFAGLLAWRWGATGPEGPPIAVALGVLLVWGTVYALRVPELAVRADSTGLTYADTHRGWRLEFSEEHASWSDVLEVNTYRVSTRYGGFIRTRVKVRGPGGEGTRTFGVASRLNDYEAFLAALHEGTAGEAVMVKGLGFLEQGVPAARGSRWRRRLAAFAVMGLLLFLILRLFVPGR